MFHAGLKFPGRWTCSASCSGCSPEGAAYSIGFANALATWARAVVPGGFAVVSELCWLRPDPDPRAVEFFATAYPDMRSVEETLAIAEDAGYAVLDHFALPREAWVEDYYEILGPRAEALLDHDDPAVREFAAATATEVAVFEATPGSYGYEFFVLRRR